jgi:hypothetical protein
VEKGKEPRRNGLARFTHLLLKTEQGWKMSRVLSFDHGPAPYQNKRNEIVLKEKELRRYDGTYKAPQSGLCHVKHENGSLLLTSGNQTFKLLPESKTIFFVIDRDLTFEFSDEKMIVREQGKIVEEAIRVTD